MLLSYDSGMFQVQTYIIMAYQETCVLSDSTWHINLQMDTVRKQTTLQSPSQNLSLRVIFEKSKQYAKSPDLKHPYIIPQTTATA